MVTGIPLERIEQNESSRLMSMSKTLSKKVVGQDDAIDKLVELLKELGLG